MAVGKSFDAEYAKGSELELESAIDLALASLD